MSASLVIFRLQTNCLKKKKKFSDWTRKAKTYIVIFGTFFSVPFLNLGSTHVILIFHDVWTWRISTRGGCSCVAHFESTMFMLQEEAVLVDCLKPEPSSAQSHLLLTIYLYTCPICGCFVCGRPCSSSCAPAPRSLLYHTARKPPGDVQTNTRQREVRLWSSPHKFCSIVLSPSWALCQTSLQPLKSNKSTHCRLHCHLAELGHSSTLGGQILPLSFPRLLQLNREILFGTAPRRLAFLLKISPKICFFI